MEDLTFEVQHPDFNATDAESVTAEEGIRRVREHDWVAEYATFIELLDAKQDCCPPSVFLRKPDDSFLHVYRTDENEYQILFACRRRKKFLGLIPYRGWREMTRQADTVDGLMDAVREYATRSNDEIHL